MNLNLMKKEFFMKSLKHRVGTSYLSETLVISCNLKLYVKVLSYFGLKNLPLNRDGPPLVGYVLMFKIPFLMMMMIFFFLVLFRSSTLKSKPEIFTFKP